MDNQDANIPYNADKLLFAEDLVSRVLTNEFRQPYEGSRATPYREFIRNTFNESVMVAVRYLIPRLLSHDTHYYSRMRAIIEPNESDFRAVVADIQGVYSTDGFDAELFLLLCTDLTIVASIFRKNGVEGAPDIAVSAIVEALTDYDMLGTGWSTLNVLSAKLEQCCKDVGDLLSPDTSSTDSGQEQELPNNPDGKDSTPQSEDDNGIAVRDKKDEFRINMADSKDELFVNQNVHAEKVESPCFSTYPSDAFKVVTQDEKKSAMKGEEKMHIIDSIDGSFVSDGIEVEKLNNSLISGEDEISQNANTFHGVPERLGATATCSKSETEMRFLDEKGPSTSNEKKNFVTHRKSLLLKEDCKVRLLDTSD